MREFVAKLIEEMGKHEGGMVKDICHTISESWYNWDIRPYAAMVVHKPLEQLPNNSTAIHVALDFIEIMRKNNPRHHASNWAKFGAKILETCSNLKIPMDDVLLKALRRSKNCLRNADLNTVPEEKSFTRKEYVKIVKG